MEHPVSEWISGVNIPSCQVMIGMGVPLHRIPDVRRMFGLDPLADTPIDFENDRQIPPLGVATGSHLDFPSSSEIKALFASLSPSSFP